MKLILIHGRAQGEFEEQALKNNWIETLNKGLAESSLTLPADVKIEFPYYGKLLDELVETAKAPLKDGVVRSGQVYDEAAEILFAEALLGEMVETSAMNPADKAEIRALLQTDRGILNWEIVQRLLSHIDSRGTFGDTILKKNTLDTYMYLTMRNIRKEIDKLVLKSFDDEPCVVVAHSMGSIIGYLLLKNNPSLRVNHFITLGSPLGLISIQNYLELPLQRPSCLAGSWYNAYDDRDYVALKPLNEHYFKISPLIENYNKVKNHTSNRHGIVGYLDDKVIAKRIYDALNVKERTS